MSEASTQGFPFEPVVLRGAALRWPAMQRWTWERLARIDEMQSGSRSAAMSGSATGTGTGPATATATGSGSGSGSAMGSATGTVSATGTGPATATGSGSSSVSRGSVEPELVLYTPDGEPGGRATVADYIAAITASSAFSASPASSPHRYGSLYASGWRFFERHPEMLRDFDEPAAAHGDLLQRLPLRAFNPLLWLFLGGDGTGTAFHRDVLDTHAWLAVLAGGKRFVLHPPADLSRDADFDEHARTAAAILDERRSRGAWRYLELHPGDLILIPSRWWHAVVNCGATLGLTRNFATPELLPRVVDAMRAQHLTRLLPWLTGEPQPTTPGTAPATRSPPCPPSSTSAT